MTQKTSQSGFTLIELLISMAIAGLLLGLMVLAFTSQSRTYNTQQDISTLQEDMKAALQLISRDIRMAGYDPIASGRFGILTPTNPLTLATAFSASADLNNNGNLDAGETIQYSLSGTSLVRNDQPVINNITQLAFEYLTITSAGATAQWNSNWTQTPGDLTTVRAVNICMQGRTARQTSSTRDTSVFKPAFNSVVLNWTPASPGNYQYRTMCIQVECRNLQL